MRVDEHTIEVAGSPVFYRRAAVAGIPSLYVHGVPTSSDDWLQALQRTGGIAPDLPGFGRSGKGGHLEYSIDAHRDFLRALLDALAVDRVDLVAHDWGAAAGLTFAAESPERVRRIVLFSPLPLLDSFRWPRLARLLRARGLGELLMGSVNRPLLARALRGASASADAWPDERVVAVWEQFDQGTQRAILRMYRATDEARLAQLGTRLGELSMPALVLWGERDPWFPVELADRFTDRLGNGRLERVAEAGHWPWLDQPALVDRLAAFLAEESE